nr:hypothetical protein CTI12_AA427390 [Tanacetum cinerariifolium]
MPPLNIQQNTNPNTSLSANSDNSINDPLSINNSDHPGMVLTQTPFNGGNFLRWSRNIKMALGAKLKLGFIDGTCAKPAVTDVNYQRWIRCDYMVTCWTGTKEKKGKKGTRMAAQVTLDEHMIGNTPFDMGFENGIAMGQNEMFDQKLVAAVCSEVMKMFKNKGVAKGGTTNANQASSSMHYACIFSCFTYAFALLHYPGMDVILDWISDTRAYDHMSPYLHLFTCVKTLKHPIIVHLPDGRTKIVTLMGQVKTTPFLTLNNVFYVSAFQLNLLFVGRLIRD